MSAAHPATQAAQPKRLRRLPSCLISQVALRATRLTVADFGSTTVRSDFAVLSGLEEHGPLSQAELGRRLGMDRSDVFAVLDRLQAASYVERTLDGADRRRNNVALTKAGCAQLLELERQLDQVQADLLEPLGPAERAQLCALLLRVIDHQHSAGT